MLGAAGVLDAHGPLAPLAEHEAEQRRRLGHPGAHHDPLGVGDHAAPPGEQRGQRGPQLGQPARIGIAQRPVRQPLQDALVRGGPGGAREQRQVRGAGQEVDQGARLARSQITRAWRVGGARRPAHPGARAPVAAQITLGGELLVRLGDEAARNPEVGGELTARRQPCPGREPPRPHGLAERRLEHPAALPGRSGGGRKQQFPGRVPRRRRGPALWRGGRSGPRWRHGSGP